MSRPRRVVPNSFQFLTRRCTQRLFLLRPDKRTTAIINYCLAEAAKRHSIDLITWLFMSNHYHAVVYDRFGLLPAFIAHFHKLVAKALNHRWNRRENLWSSAETCVTLLPTHEDVLRKVVYTLTNPAKANLVDSVAVWPGASSWNYMNGRPRSHDRPAYFSRKKKKGAATASKRKVCARGSRRSRAMVSREMDKHALLRAVPPPRSMSNEPAIPADKWRKLVTERVLAREKELRAERRRLGISPMGPTEVMRQSEKEAPSTPEPPCKVRPRLACHDKKRRKMWRKTLSEFLVEHERVRKLWVDGNYRVPFPAGTYRMRQLGARCKPHPD